jgi:hypothetical protein
VNEQFAGDGQALEDFLQQDGNLTELLETGSVTVKHKGKRLVFTIDVTEE